MFCGPESKTQVSRDTLSTNETDEKEDFDDWYIIKQVKSINRTFNSKITFNKNERCYKQHSVKFPLKSVDVLPGTYFVIYSNIGYIILSETLQKFFVVFVKSQLN